MNVEKIELYASLHFAYRAAYRALLGVGYSQASPQQNPSRLSDSAYARIIKNEWLDDEAICRVAENLSSNRIFVFNSHFYRLLELENFDSATRWFNSQVPRRLSRFCVIANLSNIHWVGFYVDIRLKLILINDSMGSSENVVKPFIQFIRMRGNQLQTKISQFETYSVIWRGLKLCRVSDFSTQVQKSIKAIIVDVVDIDDSDGSSGTDCVASDPFVSQAREVLPEITYLPDQSGSENSDQAEEMCLLDIWRYVELINKLSLCSLDPLIKAASPNLTDFPELKIDYQLAPELIFRLDEISNTEFAYEEIRLLRLLFFAKFMPSEENGSDCGVFTCAFLLFCGGLQRSRGRFEILAADEITGECSQLWRRRIARYIM